VITNVRSAALLERNAPNREETMNEVRKEINDWVARYRRDTSFSGRPSYGNTYSAVNAVAGHLNSFGPTAPIPKKRLERLIKVGPCLRAGVRRCLPSRRSRHGLHAWHAPCSRAATNLTANAPHDCRSLTTPSASCPAAGELPPPAAPAAGSAACGRWAGSPSSHWSRCQRVLPCSLSLRLAGATSLAPQREDPFSQPPACGCPSN
jgi:hypothetical protein